MDVFDAEIAEQGARLQLQAAELNLTRRNIVAPIDGIVGIVPVNIGDNVTTSTPIVTLDDRSEILVDYWVPERFANTVLPGQPVEATSVARPGQVFSGEVEAVDNRIDAASRTLRLRAQDRQQRGRAARRHVLQCQHEIRRRQIPGGRPAVRAVGFAGLLRLAASPTTSRTRCASASCSAIRISCSSRPIIKDGDAIVTQGLQRVREGGAVRVADEVASSSGGHVTQ